MICRSPFARRGAILLSILTILVLLSGCTAIRNRNWPWKPWQPIEPNTAVVMEELPIFDAGKIGDRSLAFYRPDTGSYAFEAVADAVTREPGWIIDSEADDLYYYYLALAQREAEVRALLRESDDVFFAENAVASYLEAYEALKSPPVIKRLALAYMLKSDSASAKVAREIFAVASDPRNYILDVTGTAQLRADARKARLSRGKPYAEFVQEFVTTEPAPDLLYYGSWGDETDNLTATVFGIDGPCRVTAPIEQLPIIMLPDRRDLAVSALESRVRELEEKYGEDVRRKS